jgi:hypothetical protein
VLTSNVVVDRCYFRRQCVPHFLGPSPLQRVPQSRCRFVPSSVAAQSARQKVVTLKGLTTIHAKRTSVIQVRLLKDVRVRVRRPRGSEGGDPFPDMATTGKGRLTGFYLTQPDATGSKRVYLSALQARFCSDKGCLPADRPYQFAYSGDYDATTSSEHKHPAFVELPASTYLLYFITDESPATVRLRLHGIGGHTSIQPTEEADSALSLPTPTNSTTAPGKKAFWYGHDAIFQGPAGMFFGALLMKMDGWSYLRWGTCVVGESFPPPIGYSPLCPEGLGSAVSHANVIPVDGGLVVAPFMVIVSPGGAWGFGQHFAGVFTDVEFGTLAFHLDLAPSKRR